MDDAVEKHVDRIMDDWRQYGISEEEIELCRPTVVAIIEAAHSEHAQGYDC